MTLESIPSAWGNNYELYRDLAFRGRSWDAGDRGRKIDNNTYLFLCEGRYPDHEEHLRLKLHNTDLCHFYPDRVVFTCYKWNTLTTQQRINFYTPFFTTSAAYGATGKYAQFFTRRSDCRLKAIGAPDFGLTWEPGVTCTWDGRWVPTPDKAGEYVSLSLPKAGARSRARKLANKIRKELLPHLALLQDRAHHVTMEEFKDDEFEFSSSSQLTAINRLLGRWQDDGYLNEERKRYLIDCLLRLSSPKADVKKDVLNQFISVQFFWEREVEHRKVHYTEVPLLLDVRGPEWPG